MGIVGGSVKVHFLYSIILFAGICFVVALRAFGDNLSSVQFNSHFHRLVSVPRGVGVFSALLRGRAFGDNPVQFRAVEVGDLVRVGRERRVHREGLKRMPIWLDELETAQACR